MPYVGEIRMYAGVYPPYGWAFCDGTLAAISENDQLYQVIGTTYGGDGESTFALPNLQGRVPIHIGPNNALGSMGGQERVPLTVSQIPAHTHALFGTENPATTTHPDNNIMAATTSPQYIPNQTTPVKMNDRSIGVAGESEAHENIQPYLAINFIISLSGDVPTQ